MGKKLKSAKPAAEGIHYRKLETIRWKHRSRKKEREKGLSWDCQTSLSEDEETRKGRKREKERLRERRKEQKKLENL